jgi:glutathione synthase/RimK-type ligase-like ATP-grasp enzyme
VLILSTISDVHVIAVMDALAKRGAKVELLDLSEFPTKLALSMNFTGDRRMFELRRRDNGEDLDFNSVHSAWWRRPQPITLPKGMSESDQRFAISESNTAFQGLYQSIDAHWINNPSRDAVAAHKPYQLTTAQRVGLEIPKTLMTNDVQQALEFAKRNSGGVVYKQFIALPHTWRETRRLTPEDEALAESIAYAPVIFQEFIPAVAELRVTVIDKQIFAAETDVRDAEYQQDIRMNLDASYKEHLLPTEISDKILLLMQELGLVYGAIDLRLTPEGKYVFLEINPAGQFLYIEKATGQPIAAAIADALLSY